MKSGTFCVAVDLSCHRVHYSVTWNVLWGVLKLDFCTMPSSHFYHSFVVCKWGRLWFLPLIWKWFKSYEKCPHKWALKSSFTSIYASCISSILVDLKFLSILTNTRIKLIKRNAANIPPARYNLNIDPAWRPATSAFWSASNSFFWAICSLWNSE